MSAERYIVVNAECTEAEAGTEAEKDVAIEDDWIVEGYRSKNHRVSSSSRSSSSRPSDDRRSPGTDDVHLRAPGKHDNPDDIDIQQDRSGCACNLRQQI